MKLARSGYENSQVCYREKQLQIQAPEWPQGDDVELHAGQSPIRNGKLHQEGEDRQEIRVDVVQRELHKHRTTPRNTHRKYTELF